MARNQKFPTGRGPLASRPHLELDHRTTHGPIAALNPTRATYRPSTFPAKATPPQAHHAGKQPPGDIQIRWRSRDNRKGRHALVVPRATPLIKTASGTHLILPQPSNRPSQIAQGIWRMVSVYPVWDVSYLVATIFTLGSVVWVINAFFVFLPFVAPTTEFADEILYGGGITAFIGATIFEIGSILLMIEAFNENRTACFGWEIEHLFDEFDDENQRSLRPSQCLHHHANRRNLVGSPSKTAFSVNDSVTVPEGARSWKWLPSWHDFVTHYIHEIGFLACSFQMFGATVFWISGFTALPGIYNVLSPKAVIGAYWVPQIIGGCGFVISGLMFMIETQKHWWQPAWGVLGWHIGFWNLVGGIGFTLCPCFGLYSPHWAQYQASCSTFWASWAFLLGSLLQWYESLDKFPVQASKTV